MGWTTLEYQSGQNIHKESRFIADNFAESVDHSRSVTLLDLERAKNKLRDIDAKILNLTYEREYAIRELEITGNQALGGWLCTSSALAMVEHAYKHLGWKSNLACAFIEYLRKLFFDDSKAFDNIICYSIDSDNKIVNSSVNHAINVVFGPKKYDSNKSFKIYLVGKDGMKFDWKNQFIETNIKVFKLNSEVNSWSGPMIASSPKLTDIREAICKFVKTGEYTELKWDCHERDNANDIIESLTCGRTRGLNAEKMFGYKDNMYYTDF